MSEINKSEKPEGKEFKAPVVEKEMGNETFDDTEYTKHKHSPEHDRKSIEKLTKTAEAYATSRSERPGEPENKRDDNHTVLVNKHLKDMAYARAMIRVRKQLSSPSRLFSKITHSSAIDQPSEFIGKTIARPSAMLGGALMSFAGTSLLLWATKHYGYEYNYLAVIMLFILGALFGIVIEIILQRTNR